MQECSVRSDDYGKFPDLLLMSSIGLNKRSRVSAPILPMRRNPRFSGFAYGALDHLSSLIDIPALLSVQEKSAK
jgi:hypothetical protein